MHRAYLHTKNLIHRDLKTNNLLVDQFWSCKVADFGISTVRPTITREMTVIGTPVYMAPEVLRKNKYSEKADVYSFAIVLMEIFTGNLPYSHAPFDKMNQAQLMFQIVENHVRPIIEGVHPAIHHLIEECWNRDPRLRPSFSEIVQRLDRLDAEMSSDTPGNNAIASTPENETEPQFLSSLSTNSSACSGSLSLTSQFPSNGSIQ